MRTLLLDMLWWWATATAVLTGVLGFVVVAPRLGPQLRRLRRTTTSRVRLVHRSAHAHVGRGPATGRPTA